jgi:hypothetical protein
MQGAKNCGGRLGLGCKVGVYYPHARFVKNEVIQPFKAEGGAASDNQHKLQAFRLLKSRDNRLLEAIKTAGGKHHYRHAWLMNHKSTQR